MQTELGDLHVRVVDAEAGLSCSECGAVTGAGAQRLIDVTPGHAPDDGDDYIACGACWPGLKALYFPEVEGQTRTFIVADDGAWVEVRDGG